MKMKLIQLLDSVNDQLAIYVYNADLMDHEQATKAIDKAYGDALAVLKEASENEDEYFSPGDVEDDADEVLGALGIERTHTDEHYSEHF